MRDNVCVYEIMKWSYLLIYWQRKLDGNNSKSKWSVALRESSNEIHKRWLESDPKRISMPHQWLATTFPAEIIAIRLFARVCWVLWKGIQLALAWWERSAFCFRWCNTQHWTCELTQFEAKWLRNFHGHLHQHEARAREVWTKLLRRRVWWETEELKAIEMKNFLIWMAF